MHGECSRPQRTSHNVWYVIEPADQVYIRSLTFGQHAPPDNLRSKQVSMLSRSGMPQGGFAPRCCTMSMCNPHRSWRPGFRLASRTTVRFGSICQSLDRATGLVSQCAHQATVSDGAGQILGPCTTDRCLQRFCAAPVVHPAAGLVTPEFVSVQQRELADTLPGPQWWQQVTAAARCR